MLGVSFSSRQIFTSCSYGFTNADEKPACDDAMMLSKCLVNTVLR